MSGYFSCSIGWWNRLNGATTPSNTLVSGPQMVFKFKETSSTTRHAATCGCGYDSVILIFDGGTSGATSNTVSSASMLSDNTAISGTGLTFLKCDDDEGDYCDGTSTQLTPAYDSSNYPLSGQASVISFSTTINHWYYVVVGDYNGAATLYDVSVW